MKKHALLLVIAASSALIIACGNTVYKKWDKSTLKDNIWHSSQEIVFEPQIEDINRSYNVTIGIRYLYGLQLNELPIGVVYTAPSGNTDTTLYSLKLKAESGEYLGDCSGSYCDLESEVETSFKFQETGKYKVVVQQLSAYEKLVGIMEVGLIIK